MFTLVFPLSLSATSAVLDKLVNALAALMSTETFLSATESLLPKDATASPMSRKVLAVLSEKIQHDGSEKISQTDLRRYLSLFPLLQIYIGSNATDLESTLLQQQALLVLDSATIFCAKLEDRSPFIDLLGVTLTCLSSSSIPVLTTTMLTLASLYTHLGVLAVGHISGFSSVLSLLEKQLLALRKQVGDNSAKFSKSNKEVTPNIVLIQAMLSLISSLLTSLPTFCTPHLPMLIRLLVHPTFVALSTHPVYFMVQFCVNSIGS